MEEKVALITGANSGVGLSVADRLLTEYEGIRVCLACRNKGRAENARSRLLRRHTNADISIILVDTSSVESVIRASEEIRKKFRRLDYIYLNAGIMKIASINWSKVFAIFSSQGAKILSTGWGVLNHIDGITQDGLQEVFATNLFGHYVMVRELEDCCGGAQTTCLVWSSSQNASADDFSYSNIQHRNGLTANSMDSDETAWMRRLIWILAGRKRNRREPYSSSKYATDVLSIALNDRLNEKGIYSVTTCPGLVMSNMTFGILPSWVWFFVMPFLFFMRLFVSSLTCSAYNAAEALLHIDEKDADNLYSQMEELYQGFKSKYRNGTSKTGQDLIPNGIQNGYH